MEERALWRIFNPPDPRLEGPRLSRDDIGYLAEEMLDWGLDPAEISEEAFLKARDRFIQGRIEVEDVVPLAKRYQAEYNARDLAIGELVADEQSGSAPSAPKRTAPGKPSKRRQRR